MTISLDLLPQNAFVFLLIFARIGTMAMSLPGIGDRTVPPRIRLVFALALSLVLYPLVEASLPQSAPSVAGVVTALGREILIGIALGITVRLVISAVQLAGTTIAFQTGLAFAQNVDPAQGAQSTVFGTFLSVLAVALIFATDLDHLLIAAMHDSYVLFTPGAELPVGDFAAGAVDTLAGAFRIALQMAAPFLAFGLVFYLGMGVLTRLIPQVQVFFLAMPANILLGFALLLLLLSTMMLWFLDYFGASLRTYLS